jgi:DNA-binding beta-propeller fold protein YncE
MPDLETRFRGLHRVRGPDLWPDIETRQPRPMPETAPTRRVAAAAVALALAAGGAVLVARAFLGSDRPDERPARPAATPPAPIDPVVDVTLPIKWPSSIVYGEGSIWVAALENDGTGAGTVYRIDPDTADILAEIHVATVPTWVTGGGTMETADGDLWVGGLRRLVRIDGATNRVIDEIATGGVSVGDVAIDEHGVWASVFVRDGARERMELVRLDPSTGTEEARIQLESEYAREVIATAGTIWVHEHETNNSVVGDSWLTRVDPETEQVLTSVPVGSPATVVTEGAGSIWASTWRAGEGHLLIRLDPRTNELSTIPSDDLEGFIAVGEGGIWGVTRRGQDLFGERVGIVRFDPVSGEVDSGVGIEGGPIATAVAPGSVWVVNYEGGVTRIELRPA